MCDWGGVHSVLLCLAGYSGVTELVTNMLLSSLTGTFDMLSIQDTVCKVVSFGEVPQVRGRMGCHNYSIVNTLNTEPQILPAGIPQALDALHRDEAWD